MDSLQARAAQNLTDKFNEDVATAFAEYLEEEELESVEEVVSEIDTPIEQCTLIDALAGKFKWSDQDKASCFHILRIICGLEVGDESKDDSNKLKMPNDVDWTIPTKSDCADTLSYFNSQCHHAFKDQNAAHMQIATIGRRHDINLVPLLHDIYSFYKWRYYPKDSSYDKPQFCGQSPFFRAFKNGSNNKVYQALLVTLNSIETRMTPRFTTNSSRKIVDDINAFIAYTMSVATMLNNFVSASTDCCPLLVDLWIIPNKVKEALNQNVDDEYDSEDSDEDEEDEDDEDEEIMSENLEEALKKFKAKYKSATINHLQERECMRTLLSTFTQLLAKNAKRSVKICIVIDRRKKKDNLLIYLLPLKYSAIPRNYCNETLIYSSAHHIMYDIDNSILKRKIYRAQDDSKANDEDDPIYGASQSANGFMFTLSFALHDTNKTRIQFWREGGGLRFWPRYMVEIWPELFLKPELNKKYTADFVENHFALSMKDEMFDEWFKVIAPPAKK